MKLFLRCSIVLALIASAFPLLAQDRATAIPDMKVLLENKCIRMQFHDVAVGAKTPMHSHPGYSVYVFNAYKARITLADGSQRISEHKAGDTFWNEATVHAVENIGVTPIHNLVVELKTSSSKPLYNLDSKNQTRVAVPPDRISTLPYSCAA